MKNNKKEEKVEEVFEIKCWKCKKLMKTTAENISRGGIYATCVKCQLKPKLKA